jgi:hypothetical protein
MLLSGFVRTGDVLLGGYYQALCPLETCCLEVSGLADAWTECDFNHQEQTCPGNPTNPPPSKLEL